MNFIVDFTTGNQAGAKERLEVRPSQKLAAVPTAMMASGLCLHETDCCAHVLAGISSGALGRLLLASGVSTGALCYALSLSGHRHWLGRLLVI